MKNNISPNKIIILQPNEIFVFGSNLSGFHGAGAAKLAFDEFDAIYGQGVGLQGRSYAIPTKDYYIRRTLTIGEIKPYVDDFILFANDNQSLKFLLTEIGCGLAGINVNDIAPLFKDCLDLDNVYLPQRFVNCLLA